MSRTAFDPAGDVKEDTALAEEQVEGLTQGVSSGMGLADEADQPLSQGPLGRAGTPPPQGKDVSISMIVKGAAEHGARKYNSAKDGSEEHFVGKLTHVHLADVGLGQLTGIEVAHRMIVLYAYDNSLHKIEGLNSATNLTHLYLQRNSIARINGLQACKALQKLYLEGNRILCVNGLEACTRLEELHLSNQHLPPGCGMMFDPNALAPLSNSLKLLVAANCGVVDPSPLARLHRLQKVDLSRNAIEGIEDVEPMFAVNQMLTNVNFTGNPFTRMPKYRDSLILLDDAIDEIDGKPVRREEKAFILTKAVRKIKVDEARAQRAASGAASTAGPAGGASQGAAARNRSSARAASGGRAGGAPRFPTGGGMGVGGGPGVRGPLIGVTSMEPNSNLGGAPGPGSGAPPRAVPYAAGVNEGGPGGEGDGNMEGMGLAGTRFKGSQPPPRLPVGRSKSQKRVSARGL